MTRNMVRASGGKGGVITSMVLSLLVVSFIVLLPAVKGGPIPPDPVRKELQLGKRNLTVSGDGRDYEIRSSKVVEGVEDSFKVEVRVLEDLEIALKYKESAPEAEHRLDVSLRFKDLVEYRDRNFNGIFDPEERISSYVIDNRSMGPIDYRIEDNHEYGLIHVLSTTSQDHIFSIRFYMTAELATITGEGPIVNVTPSEMKFDIDIKGFPFIENDTRMALDARLISRESVDFNDSTIDESMEIADDESGFTFNDADNVAWAFLSWANSVDVDGIKGLVVVNIPEEELKNETKRLTLNYPRGGRIFHDPKVGIIVKEVGSGPVPEGSWELSPWLLAFGFLAIAIIIVMVMSVAVYADNRRFREEASRRDPFELSDYPYYRGKGG